MEKLINLLSENSNFETKELAMMTGLSEQEVKDNIAKLEKEGIIKGYQAVIDWDKVNESGVTALIELKVAPKKDKGFDEIAEVLSQFDEVRSLTLMAGGSYDLLLKVYGDTLYDISQFVYNKVATIDGVLSTATHFTLKKYKDNGITLFEEDRSDWREKVF